MAEVKLETPTDPFAGRCWLCLSVDRPLCRLGALRDAFELITDRSTVSRRAHVCWECSAALARVQRFRRRASLALRLLAARNDARDLPCLSQLSRSPVLTMHYDKDSPSWLEPDMPQPPSSKVDDEIKIEMDEEVKNLPECSAWVNSVEINKEIKMQTELDIDNKNVIECDPDMSPWTDDVFDNSTIEETVNTNTASANVNLYGKDESNTKSEPAKEHSEISIDKGDILKGPKEKNNQKRLSLKKGNRKDTKRKQIYSTYVHNQLKRLIREGVLEEFTGTTEQVLETRAAALDSLAGKQHCAACVLGFANSADLRWHRETFHTEAAGEHACDICGERFAAVGPLRAHRAAHKTLYRCTSARHAGCGFVCATPALAVGHGRRAGPGVDTPTAHVEDQLRALLEAKKVEEFIGTTQEVLRTRHVLLAVMHGNKSLRYKCDPCVAGFKSRRELDSHALLHSEAAGPHACDICGRRFPAKEPLGAHRAAHYTLYRCAHPERGCGYVCSQPKRVVRHVKLHDSSQKPSLRQQTKCELCGGVFRSRCYYLQHVRAHTSTAHYECDACGKTFKTRMQINRHLKNHRMKYMCETCGKRCPSNHALKSHSLAHLEYAQREYECHECNKKYINKHKLVAHLRFHTGERPFRCADCPRTYTEPSHLAYHKRNFHDKDADAERKRKFVRTKSAYRNPPLRSTLQSKLPKVAKNDERFECSICGKTFKSKVCLRTHFSVHSDERPYKCDECDKSFKVYAGLYNHKYLHKGIKPYQCTVCGIAFAFKQALTTHQVSHSDVKPYECYICHKKFKYPSNVSKHLKIHNVVVKQGADRAP